MTAAKPKKEATPKRRRPVCHTCGKRIHVPKGWSNGPAVRRHYWREHRDAMQPDLNKKR